MNFQTVAANNGSLVAIFATVAEVGASKLNVNQKPIQSVTLTDDNGEQHKATINKGNGQLLDSNALGQRLAFNLSTYQGQHGVGYSGFWNSRAQVNQEGQTTPPKPPQAPSRAPESPKPDWDAIAEGKVRTVLTGAAIESGQIKITGVADLTYWVGYCMTGRAPMPPSKIPNPHPDIQERHNPNEDETPF